jgi:hypothetical protein
MIKCPFIKEYSRRKKFNQGVIGKGEQGVLKDAKDKALWNDLNTC